MLPVAGTPGQQAWVFSLRIFESGKEQELAVSSAGLVSRLRPRRRNMFVDNLQIAIFLAMENVGHTGIVQVLF